MSESPLKASRRVKDIQPSPTLAVDTRAKELAAEGRDIINFGVGEPDFNTPDNVKEAGIRAVRENKTRYTAASGIVELRKAVVDKLRRDNGLEYSPGQILVSAGAKHSIFNALQAICNPGDEVIVPAPYWVSYPDHVGLAGGVPVMVPTTEDTDFKVTPDALTPYLTDRTRAIILNSPSNPTGMAYTREELQALAQLMVDRGIAVISDEIYEYLIYDGLEHVSIASLGPEIKDLTVVINGVSKAYAMTGWRIGYAAGPSHIIGGMARFQSHATSSVNTMAQWASVEALTGPQDLVKQMIIEYAWRRDYAHKRVSAMPGMFCARPQGAFYVYPNIGGLIGKTIGGKVISGGLDLAAVLLDQVGVALVPGEAFGNPHNIRISYATSREQLKRGLDLMEELVTGAS